MPLPLTASEIPVKQMSFAACPKSHQVQHAVEEVVPESEAILNGDLPVTFKKNN